MAFITYLIQMVVKMILIAAVAFGGIRLGKVLRDKKDAKNEEERL